MWTAAHATSWCPAGPNFQDYLGGIGVEKSVPSRVLCWDEVVLNWTCSARILESKRQKTREGCGCPKFFAGRGFCKKKTSAIFRQHDVLLLPRFGIFCQKGEWLLEDRPRLQERSWIFSPTQHFHSKPKLGTMRAMPWVSQAQISTDTCSAVPPFWGLSTDLAQFSLFFEFSEGRGEPKFEVSKLYMDTWTFSGISKPVVCQTYGLPNLWFACGSPFTRRTETTKTIKKTQTATNKELSAGLAEIMETTEVTKPPDQDMKLTWTKIWTGFGWFEMSLHLSTRRLGHNDS